MSKILFFRGAPLILGVALVGFILLTNPNDLSIQFLMIPVLLIFLIAFSLFDRGINRFKFFSSSIKKRRTFSVVAALGVAVYFVFQSVGTMSLGEVLLIAVLVSISLFYVARY